MILPIENEVTALWPKQTKLFSPRLGTKGNCMMTSYALVLGLDPATVPPIEELFDCEPIDFWKKCLHQWFYAINVEKHSFESHDEAMEKADTGLYLGIGQSIRGVTHMAVFQNGIIVYDPHPGNDGLETVSRYEVLEIL